MGIAGCELAAGGGSRGGTSVSKEEVKEVGIAALGGGEVGGTSEEVAEEIGNAGMGADSTTGEVASVSSSQTFSSSKVSSH